MALDPPTKCKTVPPHNIPFAKSLLLIFFVLPSYFTVFVRNSLARSVGFAEWGLLLRAAPTFRFWFIPGAIRVI